MSNKILVLGVLVVGLLVGSFFYLSQKSEAPSENSVSNSGKIEEVKKESGQKEVEDADSVSEKELTEANLETKETFADLQGETPIYYYGSTCSHCKSVMDYLDKNDIYSKMDFIKKEVWASKENSKELTEAALKCGLNPAEIGVPFVFDSGKCYMGGPDVQDFFAQKSGLKK